MELIKLNYKENYSGFFQKIKNLDVNVQEKLVSILDKRRLDGILPKEHCFSSDYENKYDYTYKLDEKLIPYLDKFDEYFYPEELVENEISEQILNLTNELNEIYLIAEKLNETSFQSISDMIKFVSMLGDSNFQIYQKIENILLMNKKDLLIDTLLKNIKNIDITIIHDTFNNNYGIIHFFDNIKYKITENFREDFMKNVKNNNVKNSPNYFNIIRDVEKNLSIIEWYIYSNELKFLDKVHIFNFKMNRIMENLSNLYENKFIEKKTVELDDGKIFEEEINLTTKYFEHLKKIENELTHNFYLRKNKNNTDQMNQKIFDEELDKIVIKYKLSSLNEYDEILKQLKMNENLIQLDSAFDKLEDILINIKHMNIDKKNI